MQPNLMLLGEVFCYNYPEPAKRTQRFLRGLQARIRGSVLASRPTSYKEAYQRSLDIKVEFLRSDAKRRRGPSQGYPRDIIRDLQLQYYQEVREDFQLPFLNLLCQVH